MKNEMFKSLIPYYGIWFLLKNNNEMLQKLESPAMFSAIAILHTFYMAITSVILLQ